MAQSGGDRPTRAWHLPQQNSKDAPRSSRFISDAFYDGRLEPEAGNEQQCLILDPNADPALAATGLRFISIEHEGCSQKIRRGSRPGSPTISEFIGPALDRPRRTGSPDWGRRHSGGQPYNTLVNLLRSRLPEGAHVGTVDRFQGQEAAVVLISMATSSGDDLVRQIEFLYSRNRLNVAISRA